VAATPASPAEDAPWIPERDDGNYVNPVLFADYSDPDVIRVGNDSYVVSSSFSNLPGLPVLHSHDLVHWTIVGHALARLPGPGFDRPQHGKGSGLRRSATTRAASGSTGAIPTRGST